MTEYTKMTMNEQFDFIEKIADKYKFFDIEENKICAFSECLYEENNAICINRDFISENDFDSFILTCYQLARELTEKSDCIFYVCCEEPNDTYNETIVINCIFNFNEYC